VVDFPVAPKNLIRCVYCGALNGSGAWVCSTCGVALNGR